MPLVELGLLTLLVFVAVNAFFGCVVVGRLVRAVSVCGIASPLGTPRWWGLRVGVHPLAKGCHS